MTFLAALSAAGALTAWSSMIERRVLQTAFILVTALLAINQSLFIGVYSLIRLPVAIGLMSAETFHAKTPTMNGAFYSTCSYLHDHLKPGEKYYSLIIPLSYYCPQTKVVHVYFDDEP